MPRLTADMLDNALEGCILLERAIEPTGTIILTARYRSGALGDKPGRNEQIVRARSAGATFEAIGKRHRISSSMARQICYRYYRRTFKVTSITQMMDPEEQWDTVCTEGFGWAVRALDRAQEIRLELVVDRAQEIRSGLVRSSKHLERRKRRDGNK